MPYIFYPPTQVYSKLLFFHACDKEKLKISKFYDFVQTQKDLLSRLCPTAIFASLLCSTIFGEIVISQRHVVLRFEQKLQLQRKMFTQSRFPN